MCVCVVDNPVAKLATSLLGLSNATSCAVLYSLQPNARYLASSVNDIMHVV